MRELYHQLEAKPATEQLGLPLFEDDEMRINEHLIPSEKKFRDGRNSIDMTFLNTKSVFHQTRKTISVANYKGRIAERPGLSPRKFEKEMEIAT